MSRLLPELQTVTNGRQPRYVFGGRNDFSYDQWVPALIDVRWAETVGEQREALTKAIFLVAGSGHGFVPTTKSRLRPISHDIEARFKIMPEEHPELKFVAIGHTAIGYQSADEECPSPAYAVIDNRAEAYHRVVSRTSEPLDDIEIELGLRAVSTLALTLDTRFPGFEIHEKLSAE